MKEEKISFDEDLALMPREFRTVYFQLFALSDLCRDKRGRVKFIDLVHNANKLEGAFHIGGKSIVKKELKPDAKCHAPKSEIRVMCENRTN